MAVETPNGLNLGAGADVMADGSVKMGIGAGIGGEGFGAGAWARLVCVSVMDARTEAVIG